MENLLNADGTSSFTNISNLRNNFEESFAKKQLGATIKDIVVKSIAGIENDKCQNVLSDDNVKKLIGNSINEVADKCYTNTELGNNSFMGDMKKTITEFAGMEADYRSDLATALYNNMTNKVEASQKIFDLFSTESLNFKSNEVKQRFLEIIESKFATEATDIVAQIGAQVGAVIAEAEEKNVIINETSKVIQEQRDEIREELSLSDEDEEEESEIDEDDNDEYDDSEDIGEDKVSEVSDEEGTETEDYEDNYAPEDAGSENYEFGEEALKGEERVSALKQIKVDKPKIRTQILNVYNEIEKNVKERFGSFDVDDDDTILFKMFFKTKESFLETFDNKFNFAFNKLDKSNKTTLEIPIIRVRGKTLPTQINFIKRAFAIIATKISNSFNTEWLTSDYDEKKERKVRRQIKNSFAYNSIKIKDKVHSESNYMNHTIYMVIQFNLQKINLAGGLEDFQVSEIESNLIGRLNEDIDNGKVTIGKIDISNHSGQENLENEVENNEEIGTENIEFRKLMYSNDNIGKVVVPLSPTRLDTIEIPSVRSLGYVYAKSTESLDSLRNVVSSRLDLLKDIVDREQDEELTKKYEDYSKRALEGFNFAEDIQNTFNSCGITPFGLEDIDNEVSLIIASKAYKFLSGNLNVKNRQAKKSFESYNDAINAAFDISIMKDELRSSEDGDIIIALGSEIQSREDLFWQNLLDLNGDEEKKAQIKNILQLCDLDIDEKALVDNEYLKSIKLALETTAVKSTTKSDAEVNETIYAKSKEKIESFLGKDMNFDQTEIVRAMIEGRDTSDFAPTPFEKFIIKLGTDEAVKKDGGKDFELGQESIETIKNKAIALCVIENVIDSLEPMTASDTKSFKDYIN